jgi:NAD(P)-dependent dehydrogenase (short-subunit alcohol dehydrogenase family)
MPQLKPVADHLTPLALPDLHGRQAVVTGASSGIGRAATGALAAAGAQVILGVRSVERGQRVSSQPILLATTTERPGAYYGPTRRLSASGPPDEVPLPALAVADGAGELLWTVSVERTGVDFELKGSKA